MPARMSIKMHISTRLSTITLTEHTCRYKRLRTCSTTPTLTRDHCGGAPVGRVPLSSLALSFPLQSLARALSVGRVCRGGQRGSRHVDAMARAVSCVLSLLFPVESESHDVDDMHTRDMA